MGRSHQRLQWLLPLLAIVGSGLAGFLFSSHTSERLNTLERVDSPALLLSQSMSFSLNTTHDGFTYAAAAADKSALKQALDKAKQFHEQTRALGAIAPYAQEAAALDKTFDVYARAAQQVTQALLDAAEGKEADPAAAGQAMQTAHAELTKRLTQLRQQAEQSLAGGIAKAQDTVHMGLLAGLLGSLAVLGVSLWVGRASVRAVLREIGGHPPQAKAVVQRIASGDLTTPIELHRGDQSSLLFAMQGMQSRLAALIGEVRGCASSIDSSSTEIASGNADLSVRTQRQTEQLRQTSGSVDELTASVRLNSEHAQQANSLALNASSEAEHGRVAVEQVVAKMNHILQSSQRISEITTLIDGIAFQTNLLALNAAVEAARAGEQGRGFGVVAAEVGGLAQRASSAAREIKDLINASASEINEGARQAQDTGHTIGRLVDSVKRVGDLIADISAASVQQSASIEHVNRVMADLDEATQRNAVVAAQADEASSSLQAVSGRLAQTVSEFTTV